MAQLALACPTMSRAHRSPTNSGFEPVGGAAAGCQGCGLDASQPARARALEATGPLDEDLLPCSDAP